MFKRKIRDLSDLQLVNLIEDHFGTTNLRRHPSGVWLFDGSIWRPQSMAKLHADVIQILAERVDVLNANRVANTVKLYQHNHFDEDERFEQGPPNLIVLNDGYYEFDGDAWVKRQPVREYMRRIQIEATYTDQEPERFNAFLDDILCDLNGEPLPDAGAIRDLIWEMLGYCLATHTRYEQCFILCGQGANGKSVLGAVAKEMVGRKYTASVQPSQMGNVFQRSNLEGKLLNLVTELNQNAELEDGMLKAIVSGEMMSVEKKFQDVREIEPFAKHIILTNHMPRIRDYSDGLFRRVTIIPLRRQFLGNAADPHLLQKLQGEMDAITSRAMDGLARLIQNNGQFTRPESCERAKDEWKRENNHIRDFLAERVYQCPDKTIGVQELYDAYQIWFSSTGFKGMLGRKEFGKRIQALGIQKSDRKSHGYDFCGVALR